MDNTDTHMATGLMPGTVVIFTFATKRERIFQGTNSCMSCIKFSPVDCPPYRTRLLAMSSIFGEVTMVDTVSLAKRTLVRSGVQSYVPLAFSPDGTVLATTHVGATIQIWNTHTGKLTRTLQTENNDNILQLEFSPKGDELAFRTNTGEVLFICMSDGLRSHKSLRVTSVNYFTFLPNGIVLLAHKGDLAMWDTTKTKRDAITYLQGASAGVKKIICASDKMHFLTGSADNTITLWNIKNETPLKTILPGDNTYNVSDFMFRSETKEIFTQYENQCGGLFSWPVGKWTPKTNKLFSPALRKVVFKLMCVRHRRESSHMEPRIPMELWLAIFDHLAMTEEHYAKPIRKKAEKAARLKAIADAERARDAEEEHDVGEAADEQEEHDRGDYIVQYPGFKEGDDDFEETENEEDFEEDEGDDE